ncbi:lasso peptide biosynthesis B2 protein [Streptomyces paludis]|uniref:Lasso peptide biosynthesis B2 protein n=1 Tax=Streptomyces paludis TaxID=2282738 RepID=A0A345HQS0_9ACTN|nr:lasso peptide biosynthesis B2 protein [Streptomyces paludis]AXG79044.1 lasso peptide biosynthesis B2 protein [Streptomyces paludis]
MLTVPSGVHRRGIGHGVTAALAESTGRWSWLDTDTCRIWDAARAGTLPALVNELCAHGYERGQVEAAVAHIVERLTAEGLLTEHGPAAKRPAAAGPCDANGWTTPLEPGSKVPPLPVRILAAAALAVSATVVRLPLRYLLRALGLLRRLPAARPAHADLLHRAVRTVRPTWWPGRLACMEVSLATVIAAALCGRRVYWVLGARPLPNEAHAWVVLPGGGALGLDGLDHDNPIRPWVPVIATTSPERVKK